jgi:hypothetical protein
MNLARCNWSSLARTAYSKLEAWVSYPHDSRDIRGVYESSLMVLSTISKEDKARVKELVEKKEITLTLEDSDLTLTNAIANNVKEEEVKDSVLPLKSLTFKEVREYAQDNGYEIEPLLGMFRLIKNTTVKTFPSLKSCKDFITEEKEELVEGKKKITLEDSDLPTNAIALVGKVTEVKILTKMVAVNPAVHHEVKLIHDPIFGWQLMGADSQLLREPLNEDKTQPTLRFKTREGATTFAIKLMAKVKELVEKKELTFKEVQKYAENAGYELTILTNEYCNFSVSSLSNRRGKFTKLIDVVEVIKEGRLLNGEFSSLPLPTKPTDNNAIANNVKEEENMLTKESYAAIKLLVKMDFTTRGLTQFEVMALNSLRKYIENGIEPKLIKTFAEVLIKKLTPEERVQLRDLSLEKVFKGRRFDVREYFRTGDRRRVFNDLLAKENLRRHIRGALSEEDFLNLCESEGIDKDKAHKVSLDWLKFIDSMSVDCESWEDSWQDFKESEGFKELKATS